MFKKVKNKLRYLLNDLASPSKRELRKLIKLIRPLLTESELIRLGGDSDGGYLVPNDLKGISACYSPGVGNVSEFEKDCHTEGMKIFMADGSVEDPFPNTNDFHFIKKFLGLKDNHSTVTLQQWIKSTGMEFETDLLLQMDIEGAEYKILNNLPDNVLEKFRIVIVEFHFLDRMGEREIFDMVKKSFIKLLTNHVCVHIHPNNCCGIKQVKGIDIPSVAEFTFLRKDRIQSTTNLKSFPNKLDRDNTNYESIILPEIWYK